MPIYIPLFIDGYHYYIRGNKYSAPYQLTDAITYTNKDDMVVLKTMTRAIKISRDKVIVHDVHGHQYNSHVFGLYISSKRVALLLYYFAYYGFVKTAKYFGCEKFFAVYDECPIEPDPERIFFKFGSLFIGVDRKRFEDNYLLRQYIATCLSLSKKGINVESIQRVAYWKTLLGASISETKPLEKGTGLLYTFITALDHRTMINIQNLVGGSPKMTMFSVVRWMFMRYNHLVAKTGSLENKRLRLAEYIITPLIRVMYSKLYRFMNTSHKTKDVNRLLDIFKVSSAIILNAIIGKTRSKNLGLNIAKYSSYVNDMALLNVATKFTTAGPGSPMERSGKLVGASYRRFDTSSVGKVCLIATSNSDPGVSGSIVPSAQIDLKTMTFKSS